MKGIRLEVAYDKRREAWVVRPFYRGRNRPLGVYAEALAGVTARDQAITAGRKLGRVLGTEEWPCELFIQPERTKG